jgi:hypothetical protein
VTTPATGPEPRLREPGGCCGAVARSAPAATLAQSGTARGSVDSVATTRQQLNLKLPAPLRAQIVAAANEQGVSINRFCEFGLTTYLQFLQQSNPPTPARRRA